MATEGEFEDVKSVDSMNTKGVDRNQILAQQLPKIIPFGDLCRCGDEVWIENDGQLYRLRRTRQGKLILTK